ncbi:nuclear transport factor 2 family protein [Rhodococcus sp. 7Tela_A2]|uniref:nuclear transport factor 2 family protein n=1 Tax=Rhodococcus sp. 7Tela_A2 TaxID=3093744 RepID=UPI003BB7F2AF
MTRQRDEFPQVQDISLGPAERALAIREIENVFAARLRIMDTKQWDLYGSVHTEDVVSETFGASVDGESDGRPAVVGRDALRRAIEGVLDGPVPITSVHHGHTPEIVLTSDVTATGVWAMEDMLWWTNGATEEHLHGYGHYHETYRKVGGVWLIAYRNLARLRVDQTPGFFDYLTEDVTGRE